MTESYEDSEYWVPFEWPNQPITQKTGLEYVHLMCLLYCDDDSFSKGYVVEMVFSKCLGGCMDGDDERC